MNPMQIGYRIWRQCTHAGDGHATMEATIQYSSLKTNKAFRHHIIEYYGSDVTKDELANFTKACGSLLPFQLFKSCPFCSEHDDNASINLDEHITSHLLYLSQASIPGDFIELQGVELESELGDSSNGDRL